MKTEIFISILCDLSSPFETKEEFLEVASFLATLDMTPSQRFEFGETVSTSTMFYDIARTNKENDNDTSDETSE